MYPDLKDLRKELSSVGPWLISGKQYYFFLGIFISSFWIVLEELDNRYNNAFPWFIEGLLVALIINQLFYFYGKIQLGSKYKKDKIQNIVDVNFIKKTITPFLFLRLQFRYFLFLRAPYFLFIQIFYYQIQEINDFESFNFTLNLFFCILHILFLLYDYFSFRETINKLSREPLPLTPNKDSLEELFDNLKSSKTPKVNNKKIDKKKALKNNQIDKKDTMLKKFLDK